MSDNTFGIEQLENHAKSPVGHHVVDKQTGKVVGKSRTLSRARLMADKRDNAYGAYRYRRVPIYDESEYNGK